jgi:hypothetical protein
VKQLQLLVALHRASDAGALRQPVESLGNVPLKLQWHHVRLRQLAAAKQPEASVALYRDIAPLLRRGDALEAWALHELGARALAGRDAAASRLAHEQACRALARFLSAYPKSSLYTAADFARNARAAGEPVPDC